METAIGLECACVNVSHGKCRLNRKFKANGGRDIVERKLKWWVLHHVRAPSQKQHLKLELPPDDQLPDLEAIDTMQFEPPSKDDE